MRPPTTSYRGWSTRAGGYASDRRGDALIPIILDGEKAWRISRGRPPISTRLVRRLNRHKELRTVTMAAACAGSDFDRCPGSSRGRGSNGNFYIGSATLDDHKGWSQLVEARNVLDQPRHRRAWPLTRRPSAEARENCSFAEAATGSGGTATTIRRARPLEFDESVSAARSGNAYQRLRRRFRMSCSSQHLQGGRPAVQTEPNGAGAEE